MARAAKISILIFVLIIAVPGCVSNFSKFYATHADAEADAAIAKGWVPEFLPQNATDIYEQHGVDAGGVAVIFSAPSDNFLKGFSTLDHSYFTSAEEAFSLVRSPASYPQGANRYYYRCGGEGLGLLKARDGKKFYYIEPVSIAGLDVLCKVRTRL
ncbi:hypothetical protein [uncultured Xanthomonas sp.]|uniref:hypothetical protein n=1 Tax=uncultured Xanthomonas sp. TaxID=152831 RepID=UPI0025CEDB38|nr:hypothetical protein [uncultured Xanthomonas sp.]